jgi:hypothetical protein
LAALDTARIGNDIHPFADFMAAGIPLVSGLSRIFRRIVVK